MLSLASPPANGQASFAYPFQNPALSENERLDNLVSLMTPDEKLANLSTFSAVPRLGIRGAGHVEGIHGLRMGGPGMRNRVLINQTTTFPQGIGLGATWDPELLRLAGNVEGYEARYCYNTGTNTRGGPLIVMSPNADLGRDPRWGRTEECYGEDPYLNGTLVASFVRGLQGDDPHYWLCASLLKHFLSNSNEDTRDHSSSDYDERLWREYYSVPFRMGIMEGGARAFMAAYNKWNGIPCTVNPMLKDITVAEWGNDGIICTDGGAFQQLVTTHHYYPDLTKAAEATVKAGITKYLDNYRPSVEAALKQGLITEADIDGDVKRNFRVILRLGLLDPPEQVSYTKIGGPSKPWLSAKHMEVARKVTQESIVLLKNQGPLLPLDRSKIRSVAVIGPRADAVLLDWYSGVPPYSISPLAGIKAKVGTGVTVAFASNDKDGAAVKLAKESDVAIVCVGNDPISGDKQGWGKIDSPSEGREAVDRKAITLDHEDLIQKVLAANPRTVVVLVSSFPYAIDWTQAHAPAIVEMAHNSQEEGNALADVLFGDYNPAGRLTETWPTSLDQLPPLMDYDIRHGRTYMYFKQKPLYPFGFGLSYASFKYSDLRVGAPSVPYDGAVPVRVKVRNIGRMAGDEVVQLYVRHIGSGVARPLRELRGFRRVHLQPGETKTVELPLEGPKLAYWDIAGHRWAVEADRVEVQIGASSADIRLRKTVAVQPGTLPASSSLVAVMK